MIQLLLVLFSSISFAQTTPNCTATYDALGIPHQETKSVDELYYCFGFHHGADRAWQMDFFRRAVSGTNAEVLGHKHLKSDLMMRLLDIPELAARIWKTFQGEKRRWIEAYVRGVNAGFVTGKDAREFRELGYAPEPWRAEDTLAVLLLQSFDQTRKTFADEVSEEKFEATWGAGAPKLFDVEGHPWNNTILKDGEYPKKDRPPVKTTRSATPARLWAEFPALFGEESGSNNWVVDKSRSQSGHALLANDPHLDLKTPMFWYWIGLRAPEAKILGASLPGVPAVVSGTNGRVAWGLTNSYLNSADVVAIRDLKPEMIETFRPWVKVKFWFLKLPFFFKSFERLRTGERILPLEVESEHKFVLRWTGAGLTAEDIYPIFDLHGPTDVAQMDEVLSRIGVPSWNYVFADTKGGIGYRNIGKTLATGEVSGFGISVQTLEEFRSAKVHTPEERPHLLNPKRGFIHTANNRHWPRDAEFYGGRAYTPSYRAHRIEELLEERQTHTPESFKAIQCDTFATDAEFFVPKLLRHLKVPELEAWDLRVGDDSRPTAIYRRLMDKLLAGWNVNEYALFRLLDEPTGEQKDQLKRFLAETYEDIESRSWSEVLKTKFPHLSQLEEFKFSPEIAGLGDTHTVTPGSSRWNDDRRIYEQFSGASMRVVIELSDPPVVQLTLPGHNRNYSAPADESPWRQWKKCEYHRVGF